MQLFAAAVFVGAALAGSFTIDSFAFAFLAPFIGGMRSLRA
jgi:hypothetical protein